MNSCGPPTFKYSEDEKELTEQWSRETGEKPRECRVMEIKLKIVFQGEGSDQLYQIR